MLIAKRYDPDKEAKNLFGGVCAPPNHSLL
jgi:hypothetical protein